MSVSWVNPNERELSYHYQYGYEEMRALAQRVTVIWEGGMNIRGTPSLDGDVVGNLSYGQHLTIQGTVQNGDWAVVQFIARQNGCYWAFVRNDSSYLQTDDAVREREREEAAEGGQGGADVDWALERAEARQAQLRNEASLGNSNRDFYYDPNAVYEGQREIERLRRERDGQRGKSSDCVVS